MILGTVISQCWVSVFQTLVLGTLAFYKILETYSMAWDVMKNLVSKTKLHFQCTEGCMGEQASLEFDLTFDDVLLHKLIQAY